MIKDKLEIGTLEKRCLKRKESPGRYREERKQVVRRQKEYGALADGTIRRIGGSFQTQSLYDRSPRGHINIREPQGRA